MYEWQYFSGGDLTEQKRGDEHWGMFFPAFSISPLLLNDGVVIVDQCLILQPQEYAFDQIERNARLIRKRVGIHNADSIKEL